MWTLDSQNPKFFLCSFLFGVKFQHGRCRGTVQAVWNPRRRERKGGRGKDLLKCLPTWRGCTFHVDVKIKRTLALPLLIKLVNLVRYHTNCMKKKNRNACTLTRLVWIVGHKSCHFLLEHSWRWRQHYPCWELIPLPRGPR